MKFPKASKNFNFGYGGWPTYNSRPLYLQAFDFFIKNLGMIIPVIIALVVAILIGFVLGGISSALISFGLSPLAVKIVLFVIGFISGSIYSLLILIEAFESGSAIMGNIPDLSLAWNSTLNTLQVFSPTLLVTGLVFGLLSSFGVPYSFFIEGLLLILVYIVSSSIVVGSRIGLGGAIDWYTRAFSRDGISSLLVLLGALLSLIPILNLFVIPYTAILTLLMLRNY
ncbi:hypothetical protein GWK48_06955 [Metallosphaera tengchongensis]|uniref:DUF973 family protein n=1 Tax=Metallosphaera tengchongensis TaxID=1532350 RepID=A0A6N0NVB8_9CREN|nr:hypothetical protein [Metallosphaera tengchongensis]QKR00147.1 hypothetical protein GWK48_06955 [Metallosphaera tengchongensis]